MFFTKVLIASVSILLSFGAVAKEHRIVHMWEAGNPVSLFSSYGFEKINNETSGLIFEADESSGGYNHHPQIVYFGGVFYAMWSNQRYGEDEPGQRVLYATSSDAVKWSTPQELFPSPSPEEPLINAARYNHTGWHLSSDKWIIEDGKLYARAWLGHLVQNRTSYKRYGYLYRKVVLDELGNVFTQSDTIPDDLLYKVESYRNVIPSFSDETDIHFGFDKFDDLKLSETTYYKARDNRFVSLSRDEKYSHRMFVSYSNDKKEWSKPLATDIPDSPSKSIAINLPNGFVLLIGNQMAPRFDNPSHKHYERDPLMISISHDGYIFKKAYAIRCGQQKYTVPQQKVNGRAGGAQYPSAILVNDILYVIYSIGKEDIGISYFHLSSIGIDL